MKRILVWLSGWVDSAVVAYLLMQQGFDVTAWFMINYITDDDSCTTKADLAVAKEVAEFLGIKLHTFDFQQEYHDRIVKYIVESYRDGLTPNPDVMCNSEVKFKLFLEEWIALGFDAVATGHYARVVSTPSFWAEWNGSEESPKWQTYQLLKWIDPNKDQSYFLSWLDQEQLSKAIFPLWWMLKSDVREIAQQAKLPNALRKDSQWICFIGKVPMKQFLEQYIPKKKWNIIDTTGKVLGEHDWAWWYTIGQRKGLWVAAPEPLFVIAKDVINNTITVWYEKDAELYSHDINVKNRHWIWKQYQLPFSGHAKIRYRQMDQEMTLSHSPVIASEAKQSTQWQNDWMTEWQLIAQFTEPQRAVASGQIVVVYDGDVVVGSWMIV